MKSASGVSRSVLVLVVGVAALVLGVALAASGGSYVAIALGAICGGVVVRRLPSPGRRFGRAALISVLVGVVVLLVLLLGYYLGGPSPMQSPRLEISTSQTLRLTSTSDVRAWQIERSLILSSETFRAVARSTHRPVSEVRDVVKNDLEEDGWTLVSIRDGADVYETKYRTVAVVTGATRLMQRISVALSTGVDVPGLGTAVLLVPDSTSQLFVTAPRGAVASSDPPMEVAAVPAGERLQSAEIPTTLELEILRPFARGQPLRSMALLPALGWPSWFLVVLCFLFGLLVKDTLVEYVVRKTKQLASRFGEARRRSPETPSEVPRTTTSATRNGDPDSDVPHNID